MSLTEWFHFNADLGLEITRYRYTHPQHRAFSAERITILIQLEEIKTKHFNKET